MSSLKLDFFIIGAQKAGSSWIAECLRRHPDIFIPERELYFFNVDRNYRRGTRWYAQFFEDAAPHQFLGEKTPSMFLDSPNRAMPPAHTRLFEHNPGLKLIAVLRNPVLRAYSALCHHMWRRRLPVRAPIRDLLLGERADRASSFGILEQGLYHRQLSPYLDLFPRVQTKVLIFEEDIVSQPNVTLLDVCNFIGADPAGAGSKPPDRRNRSVTSRAALVANAAVPALGPAWQLLDRMAPPSWRLTFEESLKQDLWDYYANDIRQLEHLLNRPLCCWYT